MHSHKGTSGTPLHVTTNYFEVIHRPSTIYYHYDAITPEVGQARRAYEIIDKLQRDYARVFNPRAAYDGKANLFSKQELPPSSYPVSMSRNPERGNFVVRISGGTRISPSDIEQLISQGGLAAGKSTMAVNLLQIIVRQVPNMTYGFPPHARAFYIERGAQDLTGGLQAWHGFFQSVRPVLGRLLINVDIANSIVYQPGPLTELAMKFLHIHDLRHLARLPESSIEWMKLGRFLKNVQVTKVTPKSSKANRIMGLVPQAGRYAFLKNGINTTVERYQKRLSPEDTRTFLRFATQKPSERIRLIKDGVSGPNQVLGYEKSDFMKEAGMVVSSEPIQIQGRVLQTPGIVYRQGQMVIRQKTGAWNLIGQQLLNPSKIKTWAVLVFDDTATLSAVQQFIMKLVQNLQQLVIDQPYPFIGRGNAQNPYDELTKAGKKAVEKETVKTRPTLLLVILPKSGTEVRKKVKHWGDVINAIPTQCVGQGKWERGSDQYCCNVALKINVKIGGVNSAIKTPFLSFLSDAMIVGADVGHPGPGITNRPSITSLVASVDPNCTRYTAFARVQKPRQEIIEDLGEMFKEALKDYYGFRNTSEGPKLPSKIIFYRDGVSEGEYAEVAKREVDAIETALHELNLFTSTTKPKIVFTIVGKRHHVRFFPGNREAADSSGNCPPGFVVDDQIINSAYPDFYLQSHSGIIGKLQYGDSDAASGNALPTFDLRKWQDGFKQSPLNKRMYFL
ncbi:hypothetical protein AcV7_008788 [Taiwanofungus camphoratus]|nr:hypothetical protein AcV7_008788 [Antrodia cinnamomea]